jgi:hypothetical protein
VRELSKWPRLLVVGKRVTPQQAGEILLRTNSWHMWLNDRAWMRQVGELANLPVDDYGMFDFQAVRAFERRYRVLALHHLHNHQIGSPSVAGAHGWCVWNGAIGCGVYNIGKWPSIAEVTEDWETIAAAFPYLDLRAQLVPDEGTAGFPAVEWHVSRGRVELDLEPVELLRPPVELDETDIVARVLLPGGERGVSAPRLAEALSQLRSRHAHSIAQPHVRGLQLTH